jgi:protein-S-isoprenylcysteine O-methyltransferase Ste14
LPRVTPENGRDSEPAAVREAAHARRDEGGATRTPRPATWVRVLGALLVTILDAVLLAVALGGVGALLHHARALALLAAWAVGGITLAVIQPVRTHDPVEVRSDPPALLLALFLIPLVTPPLSAWAERAGAWLLPGGATLRWIGVALSAVGFAIRIAAMARLGSRFSPLVAVQRAHALETRGLYARIRHPGYLGSWLVTLGACLAFGSAATLPLAALMLLVLFARLRSEERVLERHFGEEYRSYRARTGALLPRLGGPSSAQPRI